MSRLVLSINDDGTVTIRCDANAFFAHAHEIRRLLAAAPGDAALDPTTAGARDPELGPDLDPTHLSGADLHPESLVAAAAPTARPRKAHEPRPFGELWAELAPHKRWGRDLSPKGALALAAGYYLTRERGFTAFTCADLLPILASLPAPQAVQGSQLVYLCRRGWLERVRRGAYRLSQRAVDRVESVREVSALPPAATPKVEPPLPNLIGLSRFLKAVPSARKWRRTLLVAYFLQEHCGVPEFDHHLLAACFKRLRGVETPGSLASLLSQHLHKRQGLLERGTKRGMYRLTETAREELRREARVAKADALHRSRGVTWVAKTG
ncbi:MAG: type IV toxin-antitoxin system AbiEi family antitoxin domain-containing protein [Planctomycetota bacterium]